MKNRLMKKGIAIGLTAAVVSTCFVPTTVSAKKVDKKEKDKVAITTSISEPSNWIGKRHSLQEAYDIMDQLAENYPKYVELSSIGATTKGNEIKVLKIASKNYNNKNENAKKQKEGQKPKKNEKTGIAYLANIHGDEREAGESALYLSAWFLENLNSPEVQEILDKHVIYIIPILNPDSYDIFEYFVRGTSQLLDKNGDGVPCSDVYEDITGDGWIGYLYATDEDGKRTANIGYESTDQDANGWLGDDSWASGYDINRNFDFQWAYEHAGKSSGEYAASEIETQHIQNFLAETPLEALVTVHTGIQAILYPWGYRDTDTNNPEEVADIEFMANTAEKMRKAIESTTERNYYVSNSYHDYQTYSELIDYAYGVHGIHTYTMEVICEGYDPEVTYKPDRNPNAFENNENFNICLWNDPAWEGSRREYIPIDEFKELLAAKGMDYESIKVQDRTTKAEKKLSEMDAAYIEVNSSERNQRGYYVAKDQDKLVEGAKNAFLQMIYSEGAVQDPATK